MIWPTIVGSGLGQAEHRQEWAARTRVSGRAERKSVPVRTWAMERRRLGLGHIDGPGRWDKDWQADAEADAHASLSVSRRQRQSDQSRKHHFLEH